MKSNNQSHQLGGITENPITELNEYLAFKGGFPQGNLSLSVENIPDGDKTIEFWKTHLGASVDFVENNECEMGDFYRVKFKDEHVFDYDKLNEEEKREHNLKQKRLMKEISPHHVEVILRDKHKRLVDNYISQHGELPYGKQVELCPSDLIDKTIELYKEYGATIVNQETDECKCHDYHIVVRFPKKEEQTDD